ncbi:DcaP family trimeric outer membrane transporter [Flagellimonas sp. DF-77]|uniref:DcaP family trimeric outer membrane transporter n=1 Tax=Flagellimonas algarum TaxID=3230298 RepID=UPI00339341BB
MKKRIIHGMKKRFIPIRKGMLAALLMLVSTVQCFYGQDQQQANDSIREKSRQPLGRFPDDAVVTRGTFDRSIQVPGTQGAFRVGGNVIVNTNYDFDNLGFQDISFQPTIPLDGSVDDEEQQFRTHVRFSKVNFDYRSPTKLGEFRVFLEFDFFNPAQNGEFVNDYGLRLRHAVAELGNWKFGQFWSGFMDVFSQPETADPGGPLGLPSKRNPGIYYVRGERKTNAWGLGLENPTTDLSGETDLQRSESLPSFVGFYKLSGKWGYTRLAAMTLQHRSTEDDLVTGAVHLSGRFNLPFIKPHDNIAYGFQAGEGFAHYYSSFVLDLDGIIRADGEIETSAVLGGFLAYQHWWSKTTRSTVNASFLDLDHPDGFNPLAYAKGYRLSGNLVMTPIRDFTIGAELNYDTIETFNGLQGEGIRLEIVSRFDF